MGSNPGSGRSHMLWSNSAHVSQLSSLCSRAREPQTLSPCPATTEVHTSWSRAPQQEKAPQWEASAPQQNVAPLADPARPKLNLKSFFLNHLLDFYRKGFFSIITTHDYNKILCSTLHYKACYKLIYSPQTAVLLLLYSFEEKGSGDEITYPASHSCKVTVLALEFRSMIPNSRLLTPH